jgi:hypothetical protein
MARDLALRSLLTPPRIALGVVTFVASAAAGAYEALRGEEAPRYLGCLSNAELDDLLPNLPERQTRRAA